MVGKKKLRYKNFNICQLVDKGKLKLHYFDEYKEAKKIHGDVNKRIEHEDKKCRSKKSDVIDFENPISSIEIEKNLNSFIDVKKLVNSFSFEFLNNCCKFVEIQNTNDDTNFFAILILEDCGLLFDDIKFVEEKNNVIVNEEEIGPYLTSFNMIKNKYDMEDIKKIIYRYLKSKENKNKKLVKE